MEKQRRMAKGELAEIFGKDVLLVDKFMRNIGLHRISKEGIKSHLSKEDIDLLQAYADGVNDYVQGVSLTDSEKTTGRFLPPEFVAFGISKESYKKWEILDSLVTIKLINLNLTWNWGADLQKEILRQNHRDLFALLEDLMPFTADRMIDDVPVIDDDDLKRYGLYSDVTLSEKYRQNYDAILKASPPLDEFATKTVLSPDLKEFLARRDELPGGDSPLLGGNMASNHWVVHGDHTETGLPLFASDPHLKNGIPSSWIIYNSRLNDGSQRVSTAVLPGIPLFGIGRTKSIVWAFTTTRCDTSDLWQE